MKMISKVLLVLGVLACSVAANAKSVEAVRWDFYGADVVRGYFVYPAAVESNGVDYYGPFLESEAIVAGTVWPFVASISFQGEPAYVRSIGVSGSSGSDSFWIAGDRGDYLGFRATIAGVTYCGDNLGGCDPGFWDYVTVEYGFDGPFNFQYEVFEPQTFGLLSLGLLLLGWTRNSRGGLSA